MGEEKKSECDFVLPIKKSESRLTQKKGETVTQQTCVTSC